MGGVGEAEAAGEDAAVAGADLAVIERDGNDRPLAGAPRSAQPADSSYVGAPATSTSFRR